KFALNKNRSYPTRILARGNVTAQQKQMTLNADHLDLSLRPGQLEKSPAPAARPAQVGAHKNFYHNMQLQQIIAGGDVRVDLVKQHVTVLADQLIVDPVHAELTIMGTNKKPAQVKRAGSALQAKKILMQRCKQTVDVPGPGKLVMALKNSEKPPSSGQVSHMYSKATLVTRWQGSMHY